MRVLSLFSGAGGMDLGLERASSRHGVRPKRRAGAEARQVHTVPCRQFDATHEGGGAGGRRRRAGRSGNADYLQHPAAAA